MTLWSLKRKPRLLVVDDNKALCDDIARYFEDLGADVLCANRGEDGLSLYSTQLIDVAVLDITLPDMDGPEILQHIKSMNKHTPIFFMAVKGTPIDIGEMLALGAADYITKPFDIEELERRVQMGLRQRSIYLRYIARNEDGEVSNHVFISYSHKDSDYTHRLAAEIEKYDIPVWIDDRIDYGTRWPHVIQEKIDTCKAFILIMSDAARESEWVNNELTYAQGKKKKIYPLLLKGDVWLSVASIQYVNALNRRLPKESFFKNLKEAVS